MTSKELISELIKDIADNPAEGVGAIIEGEKLGRISDDWMVTDGYSTHFSVFRVVTHMDSGRMFEISSENGGSWDSLEFYWDATGAWEEVQPYLETVTRYRVVTK